MTLVALVAAFTRVALASTTGCALSRTRCSGRSSMLHGLLVTQMFPATVRLLPLYLILISFLSFGNRF